ncbi:MAG: hypothetical protein LUF87_10125 [Alistipes sp.]|nr:hypothetical protein [Alistipes sp.]
MKKFILILAMAAAASLAAANDNDPQYRTAMEQAIEAVMSARELDELMAARQRFEMIAGVYPERWMPLYYIAYCDLDAVFKGHDSQALLDDAKSRIETLLEMDGADLSEVYTLYGYYYFALIAGDPGNNGQLYYAKPTEYFNRAIELDPENPRPLIVRAFYVTQLPDFIRPRVDVERDTAKAAELFAAQEPGVEKPQWGEFYYTALAGRPLPVAQD